MKLLVSFISRITLVTHLAIMSLDETIDAFNFISFFTLKKRLHTCTTFSEWGPERDRLSLGRLVISIPHPKHKLSFGDAVASGPRRGEIALTN